MPSNRQGKWQPFDALEGYKEKIKETEAKVEKISKPLLSEDQEAQISEMLNYSLQNQERVIFTYFVNGRLLQEKGVVKKIDLLEKIVKLDQRKSLKLLDIIDISKE